MTELTNPRVLWLKAGLFVLCGILALAGLLLEHPTLRAAVLMGLAIWSFCRAYYFAFYVLEHYIDPTFRYAGLLSAVRHLFRSSLSSGRCCYDAAGGARDQIGLRRRKITARRSS